MTVFYLWDIIPILGIIALIVAAICKSRSMKQEEAELIELLESLGAETKTDEKDNETTQHI